MKTLGEMGFLSYRALAWPGAVDLADPYRPGRRAKDVSMYTACRAAEENGRGDVFRGRRLVAFYCEVRGRIVAGYGATDEEREGLVDMFGQWEPLR